MNTLFGFSMDSIMQVTLGAFLAVSLILAVLALGKDRLLLKLALRNVPRRRAQSLLIVFGLMLSTAIVASAFTAGDTFSYSIRSSAAANLGAVDETVTHGVSTKGIARDAAAAAGPSYFSAATAGRVGSALASGGKVDGVTGVIAEAVPLQDLTTRQTKTSSFVAGAPTAYPASFGPLVTTTGSTATLGQLGPNQVYLNDQAASELNAHPGDTVRFFVGNHPITMTVRAILRSQGLASGGLLASNLQSEPEALLPLSRLQAVTGHPGQITEVLISNQGDTLSGAALTNQVVHQVHQALPGGYTVTPVKQQAIDAANQAGTEFTAGLTAFGLFSIAAGITLIFLIFVMLAAERRTEMGVARAIGTKRRHLVEQFIFEGYAYDLGAALVGVILGAGIGLGMTSIVSNLFNSAGFFRLQRHVEPRSLVVAFTVGALVTFVTVAISAWRVSHLNIVAAIRDLPDDVEGTLTVADAFARPWKDLQGAWSRLRRGKVGSAASSLLAAPWHLVTAFRVFITRGPLLLAVGYPLIVLGLHGKQDFPFTLGISFLIIGSALSLRWILTTFRVPERIRNRLGFSLAGIGLVVFWLLPLDFFRSDLQIGVEMYVLYGIMLALGGAWTVMYNADILLGGLLRLGSGLSRINPIVKMAVTYPLQHRFRTGMALFMFCLVIVALMVQAVLVAGFSSRGLNLNADVGGYQIYGTISPSNPIRNVTAQIAANPTLRGRITAAGAIAPVPVYLRQPGVQKSWQGYRADIADDSYLAGTRFTLHSRAAGYTSDAQVWQTIRTHPGYAVVDSGLVPSKSSAANGKGAALKGFYYEDKTFKPVHVEMRDARTGKLVPLTIIGVIDPSVGFFDTLGVYTSQASLAAVHDPIPTPTSYYFRVAPGQNVHQTALALGSAFLPHGLDVQEAQAEYNTVMSLQVGFNNLLEGFVALGLVVGIAALGVIATRSVVERRQQIGMLRAIGFKRRMVQTAFLLESSFVAITGTLVGSILGLILGHQVVSYIEKTNPSMAFVIPWPQVILIVIGAYVASLLTTYLPAWQASRVYPAEALRYE